MEKFSATNSVSTHFVGKDPSMKRVYDRLIVAIQRFGPVKEEAKKTSIHLVNVSALAGVEVRNNYLLLDLNANHRIESPRVERSEQISSGRFHHKIKLASVKARDNELQVWLKEADELSG
jgi:hypothetical protein